MFARILEFELKAEKKAEFVKAIKNEVLPNLRKQVGFLEMLPFFPEQTDEKRVYNVSFWSTKADAERYQKELFPKIYETLKPYLNSPIVVKHYMLETTLCEHFVQSLAA